ncbi:MAG: J domain-containing protein [Timaviella obliquedivisa GSE-PSE-MK23-08B]|jgi:curved DNA-binding protein CbpA|nr:J domain-containing protein [Timaviella obliquedivisa GSE-PSE-MK23-08B]
MSLKIEQGLFNLDFTDYHAILGVPVDADMKDIRKGYLKIARRLHPDSCAQDAECDRQQAAEFLSKMVNPAYEKLSQERNYTEYCVLLRIKGQQALKQQETVILISEPARKLAAASDIDNFYRITLKNLAERQYEHLGQTLDLTGQISEMNLVYLMRKEGRGELNLGKKAAVGTPNAEKAAIAAATSPKAQSTNTLVAAYLRRAQEYEKKRDYSRVILELRDATRIDPRNSECHSRLGEVYLKTNQAKMAKIHFTKALELNAKDEAALAGMKKVEGSSAPAAITVGKKSEKVDPKATPKSGKVDPKPEGGLFGLFGGKKK